MRTPGVVFCIVWLLVADLASAEPVSTEEWNTILADLFADGKQSQVMPVMKVAEKLHLKARPMLKGKSRERGLHLGLAGHVLAEYGMTLAIDQTTNDVRQIRAGLRANSAKFVDNGVSLYDQEVSAENLQIVIESRSKTNLTQIKSLAAHSGNKELLAELERIAQFKVVKGPFESTTEFEARVAMFAQAQSRLVFQIRLPIKNAFNSKSSLVHFEADARELVVALPQSVPKAIRFARAPSSSHPLLYSSFVALETELGEPHQYQASNALGRTVSVTSFSTRKRGIAVLNDASDPTIAQTFSFGSGAEEAKNILESGSIVMFVGSGNSYLNFDQSGPLIVFEEKKEATFADPIEYEEKSSALPVYLLAISVTDRDGHTVFEQLGNVRDPSPLVP